VRIANTDFGTRITAYGIVEAVKTLYQYMKLAAMAAEYAMYYTS
jgi:hypothetical protein